MSADTPDQAAATLEAPGHVHTPAPSVPAACAGGAPTGAASVGGGGQGCASALPRIAIAAYWVPKDGSTPEEYEDAYAMAPASGRVAVADGATESSFSGRWARSLVAGFIANPPGRKPDAEQGMQAWLSPLQQDWYRSIGWDALKGTAKLKASYGAHSTVLGLEIDADDGRAEREPPTGTKDTSLGAGQRSAMTWRAVAVGDSCMFLIRGDQLLRAFPLDRSELFSRGPMLLSSHPTGNEQLGLSVFIAGGTCMTGDVFLLVTDALAEWLLSESEHGLTPWTTFNSVADGADFVRWVKSQRQNGRLKNDDTTLLLVSVLPLPQEDADKRGGQAG